MKVNKDGSFTFHPDEVIEGSSNMTMQMGRRMDAGQPVPVVLIEVVLPAKGGQLRMGTAPTLGRFVELLVRSGAWDAIRKEYLEHDGSLVEEP